MPSLLTVVEVEGVVFAVLALAVAALTLIHWGWLRLVDSLPDPEPRRAKREAGK